MKVTAIILLVFNIIGLILSFILKDWILMILTDSACVLLAILIESIIKGSKL